VILKLDVMLIAWLIIYFAIKLTLYIAIHIRTII